MAAKKAIFGTLLHVVTKHVSCKCECNFDNKKCYSNQKWNNDKCLCECKNPKEHRLCEKHIFGILQHVTAKMLNM